MSFYVTTSGHLTYKYAGEEYTIDSSELAGGSWEVSASPQFKEDDTEYSSRYTAGTRHGTFAWTVTMSVGVSGSSISDWWPEYPIGVEVEEDSISFDLILSDDDEFDYE